MSASYLTSSWRGEVRLFEGEGGGGQIQSQSDNLGLHGDVVSVVTIDAVLQAPGNEVSMEIFRGYHAYMLQVQHGS